MRIRVGDSITSLFLLSKRPLSQNGHRSLIRSLMESAQGFGEKNAKQTQAHNIIYEQMQKSTQTFSRIRERKKSPIGFLELCVSHITIPKDMCPLVIRLFVHEEKILEQGIYVATSREFFCSTESVLFHPNVINLHGG
jgi:hypothetical protein